MSARETATAEGFPEALFLGLCEWLETHPVDASTPEIRFAPNTRAQALRWCRVLKQFRAAEELTALWDGPEYFAPAVSPETKP